MVWIIPAFVQYAKVSGRRYFPVFLMTSACQRDSESPERVMRGQLSGGGSLTLVSSSQSGFSQER